MRNDIPQAVAARTELERALTGREDLVRRVEELLFADDPIGINFGVNPDEYRPEAQTIVLRLPEAASSADVHLIVYEEFVRWFDQSTAGVAERYLAVAADIWELWQAQR